MTNRVDLKPALTINQQLDLLSLKGLVIDNFDVASQFLAENNYYRLNVYFHKLMETEDHFLLGTNFSRLINIYQNDCYLRRQIYSLLEPIEIEIKSKIAYFLGLQYGSDVFYKKEIYESAWKFEAVFNTFWREISRNDDDPVVLHHYNQYSGYFPIWVIVEYLTFNCISKYYSNLKPKDQKTIAREGFGLNEYYFKTWIHSLSVMRNNCAHFGYLYQRDYKVPISFGKKESKIFINQERTLFGIFYCMHKLTKKENWDKFITNIYETIGKETLIRDYNFPDDFSCLTSD